MRAASHPAPAIARAVFGQPLVSAVSADFKKGTITFASKAVIDPKVDYVLVPEPVARAAFEETENAGAVDKAIVLLPPSKRPWFVTSDRLERNDHEGNNDRYYRHRFCPDNWIGSNMQWHPSYWYEFLVRRDAEGRSWNCAGLTHVVDDFGMLVALPGDMQ